MENGKQEKNTDKDVKTELSRYEKIRLGLEKPQGSEKGWLNLEKRTPFNTLPPERQKEIRRLGAQAVHKLHGEKKSAKQSLEKILTLRVDDGILAQADVPTEFIEKMKRDNPDATLYDLIQLVAVGRAVSGNMTAYQLIRDTHGDKPIDRVELTDNVMTDNDRALLRSISDRLEQADAVQIVQDITDTDVKTTDTDG